MLLPGADHDKGPDAIITPINTDLNAINVEGEDQFKLPRFFVPIATTVEEIFKNRTYRKVNDNTYVSEIGNITIKL